ncbi:hypothetical protein D3C78_842240 [compost metagenome]
MQVRRAFNQPTVAIRNDFWRFIGIRKFAGDRFKHVQRCHQTLHHAKFVGHDHKTTASTTQNAKQVDRVQRFRNHYRGGRGGNRFDVRALFQTDQHLFSANHTDDFIQFTTTYREQAVW